MKQKEEEEDDVDKDIERERERKGSIEDRGELFCRNTELSIEQIYCRKKTRRKKRRKQKKIHPELLSLIEVSV